MHTIPAYRGEEDMAQYMQAMLGCRVCRPGARREREREDGEGRTTAEEMEAGGETEKGERP